MATRLKTVEFAHPVLAAMVDNTLTSMTQITVYLPESPSGSAFKSVIAQVTAMQTGTATGNITSRRMQCRVGAAGYTNHANANLHTGSGEDIFTAHAIDLTAHFVANWSGTSMTFDTQVLMDGTATGVAWTNVCVTLYVTYNYDDTSATQIKTIRIPLDGPVANPGTTKPAALATIPNLSTELPEASKVFRSMFITVQGNINRAAATDATFSMELDATGVHTTGVFEGVSNSDFWYRYIWDCSAVLNTSAAMSYYFWSSLANCFNHPQAWLTVTYEFDATAANDVFVSIMVPMEMVSPIGGTASTDAQHGDRELWIQEPGTITTKQIAYYLHFDHAAAIAGLNARIGTGSYVTYTNRAATLAGGDGLMIRNDSAFTLARGRNGLTAWAYRTDTADFGMNLSGFWIVNYTAGKPSGGYGAANHTVLWNLGRYFDGAANVLSTTPAVAPAIPETSFFYAAVGTRYHYISNGTGSAAGVAVLVERLTGEGGPQWESAYTDIGRTDPETGIRNAYSQVRSLFKRWAGDPNTERMTLQDTRRWRTVLANACNSFDYLDLIFSYHTITYTVADSVTGFSGTVDISAHRADGEKVAATTRSGDGAFSMPWYDNTEPLYVVATDGTNVGRSQPTLAA